VKNRVIVILVTTLVCGAIGHYTMLDIKFLLNDYQEQIIRRAGRRTRTRREYDLTKIF